MTDPASTRQDARVVRTREALRRALLTLLENQSFDQITVRDIVAQASAGYATFFRHYKDKQELLSDLAAGEISELLTQAVPVLFEADTRQACRTLCEYVGHRRELWAALLTGGAAGALREELLRQAGSIQPPEPIEESWLPADLSVIFGVSGMLVIISWWLRDRPDMPVEQVAKILDQLVVTPALTR
ncbi:TetR/AcrR family transcriptional regulator [Stakelama tenebrarum]|uniref:TetR family transcriptional regulator n=1 Tax=Stakelama tenebrarum TaxID=2711215 RepID=A0A6G6Y4B3_9SPHN|nr:TetR/AcrR family transcriptional regulator [Sphingosinithalassobacter tenebrarum]QIG79647.1 TetR family transcriptional regulator [Sphingosinithalassobacter tenebrarum]